MFELRIVGISRAYESRVGLIVFSYMYVTRHTHMCDMTCDMTHSDVSIVGLEISDGFYFNWVHICFILCLVLFVVWILDTEF